VFGEDGACRSLEASAGTTARQLCETLVRRTRALQDHSWALVELHQHLALGELPARRGTTLHGTAQHGTIQLGIARHGVARHCMAWHSMAWHSMAWHSTAWHGVAWHRAAPSHPAEPRPPAERCLEDHESVVEVQSSWPPGADSRFVFRKNFAKYELFKSNTVRGHRRGARGDLDAPRGP